MWQFFFEVKCNEDSTLLHENIVKNVIVCTIDS